MAISDKMSLEDIFKNMFVEDDRVDNPENYLDGAATIPELQQGRDPWEEYKDCPEERIWCPVPKIDEAWVPFRMFMRSVLTCAQVRRGVPNEDAMENSCSGYAEQYMLDIVHESGFVPEVAIGRLATTEFPDKLIERWTPSEIDLFSKGLGKFGKKFASIRAELLPHKTTKDLVEFYYTWKRAKMAKGSKVSRSRRSLRRRITNPSDLIIDTPKISGMVTRSKLAANDGSGASSNASPTSRKEVFTAVKRKRRAAKQTRSVSIEA